MIGYGFTLSINDCGVVFLLQSLQFLLETCKILVIGAGGLGCDLLKNLVGPRFQYNCVNERAKVQA